MKMRILMLMVLVGFTRQLAGQWPKPAGVANTPVQCTSAFPSCAGMVGKLTAGWPSPPLAGYVGRFLDSSAVKEFQNNPRRTLRARLARVAPERDRIYMIQGSTLVAYRLSTFFTRIEGGEAMVPLFGRPGNAERFLNWNTSLDPERSNEWIAPVTDGQDRLFGFDFDDRGYVYPAYSSFGWGAVFDDQQQGFQTKQQVPASGDLVDPFNVVSVKSAGRYFVIASSRNAAQSNVWDVTNVAAPRRLADIPISVQAWAKAPDRIAVVAAASGNVRIYSAAGILVDQPIATFRQPPSTNTFTSIDTDGTNFYAVSFRPGEQVVLSVFSPMAPSYGRHDETLPYSCPYPPFVRWGAGYLTIFSGDLHLYKTTAAGIVAEQPAGNFFEKYYGQSINAPMASPPSAQIATTGAGVDALPVQSGSSTYLLTSFCSIGDVWRLPGSSTPAPQPTVTPAPSPTPTTACPCPTPTPQPSPQGAAIVVTGSLMHGERQVFKATPCGGCRWSWGDGTATTATGSIGHTFTLPGNYTVSVTANNGTPVQSTILAIR